MVHNDLQSTDLIAVCNENTALLRGTYSYNEARLLVTHSYTYYMASGGDMHHAQSIATPMIKKMTYSTLENCDSVCP